MAQPAGQTLPAPFPVEMPPIQARQHMNIASLRRLPEVPDMDMVDVNRILKSYTSIPRGECNKAEGAFKTTRFRHWLTTPTSRELLVLREFHSPSMHTITAFSLMCATLAQAMRAQQSQYISLVLFCGSHVGDYGDDDDDQTMKGEGDRKRNKPAVGRRAIARSFIAQLLRQHPFDTVLAREEHNLSDGNAWYCDQTRQGNMRQLCVPAGVAHPAATTARGGRLYHRRHLALRDG
ncbi:hypothetical protein N657DRAFT_679030 [Parathielavia appendiculata]|uniref:Uncharacterized protein n=1 Tax=Parathielavia appendiculata TaxID=2587402 RepID=A0AAN6U3Z9_9PEZI|nr:hypothetical protein N657DRAFT_679030 [Parathielavia appendiculata]